ncbi:hypothetical protein H5J25_13385 [Sphingomonas aliaeris]|uniref:Uncharacterized protein n=1 Tax=Sphingomonas aliaeris TaxID=2759526 RepID=A0A974S3I7_9SPHN|nr:hypothetical protein [Sphingomonas aliaeris]QQV76451.1 hypothetical protein H5J25_13385 [Sphingomonas aliaeris]
MPAIGDAVTNPETGLDETVSELVGNYAVRADKDNVILLAQTLGDTYTVVTTDANDQDVSKTYEVTAVTSNTAGKVVSVTIKDVNDATVPVQSVDIVQAVTYPSAGGGSGSGTTPVPFGTASGDINQSSTYLRGNGGGSGRNGAGVCIPYIGCAAVRPNTGGNGATGTTVNVTIAPDATKTRGGNIETVSGNLPGVIVASVGGNGGKGGNAFGNIQAARGGTAGDGGTATATTAVDILTSGANSHGVLVQSIAGAGGQGGTGILAATGGTGGSAAKGGSANAYNTGNITTTGGGAVGMLVQSLGGNAGSGGNSYGFVGQPGQGSLGGTGGTAYAQNGGVIRTAGDASHGMLVQSVGGGGGAGGDSGGLVTIGGKGGGTSSGGTVSVSNSGSIATEGDRSYAIQAQSIGGGGNAGSATTLSVSAIPAVSVGAAIGGVGGTGGAGGDTTLTFTPQRAAVGTDSSRTSSAKIATAENGTQSFMRSSCG